MNSPSSPAPDGKPHEEPFGSGAGGEPHTLSAVEASNPPVELSVSSTAAASGGPSLPVIPGEGPPDFIPVRAAEDMLCVRHEQIHKFGHTLEADRQRPIMDWARDVESAARAILEDAQFHKPAERIRKRAIKLGALLMALADRLDSERLEGEGQ